MQNKYRVIQKRNGLEVAILTEDEKVAHENDPQLRGKYTYELIKKAPVPKEATPAKPKKTKSTAE